MPKTKSNPKIETRLTPAQYQRLLQAASAEGVSNAEFVRRATITYLDEMQKKNPSRREGALEKRLRNMEDRFAAIMVRTGVDIGSLYALLWAVHGHSDSAKQKQAKDHCYMQGVRRFKASLSSLEKNLKGELARGEMSLKEQVARGLLAEEMLKSLKSQEKPTP